MDSVFDELVEVVAENVDMSLADDMLVVSGVDDGLQEDEKEGEEVFKGWPFYLFAELLQQFSQSSPNSISSFLLLPVLQQINVHL